MRLSSGPRGPVPRRGARAVLALAVLALASCTNAAAGGFPAAEVDRATVPVPFDVVGFAVVGDSITAGLDGPIEGTTVHGATSWVPAAEGPPLDFRGGWAAPGASTRDMRAGVQPVSADVLVVMGGTNDIGAVLAWERCRADLLAIVATADVDEVVVAAIPPLDAHPAQARRYNVRLEALARQQGWTYVDPWAGIATPGGTWAAGTSPDGIHPTEAVADVVGTRIRAALLDSARG
jgi:lysophospholipase L1-like esterase